MSAKLNPPQREAIRHLDGPLLVLAGAGSGKTRVITHKIAYLIEECEVQPAHIAAITFTNKAAREMQERIARLMPGRSLQGLTISTFHSLGARMLRQEAKLCELKPGFSILDAGDCLGILGELMRNADKAQVRAAQGRISRWKNDLVDPEQALENAGEAIEAATARLYAEYERTLRAYQAVDFDDLIGLPVRLLDKAPEVLARWQGRLRHLLVDEYQDTNKCQYRMLKLLAGPRAAFTAVGDDDQSIYAWRGADVENLHLLQKDFPQLKVIKLEQNYRSTVRILQAANSLIAHNPKLFEKKLWSEHGHGDAIQVHACRDGEHEAELVVMKLQAHKFQQRTRFADYAILYRGNHQARAFEQQLRDNRIPYVMSGGQSFFDRAEIKDITCYLRLIANNDDDPAFIRAVTTPKRGIGAATIEALGRYAGQRRISLFAAAFEVGAESHVNVRQLAAAREFGVFINRMASRAAREPAGELLEELLKSLGYENWLFESCEPREAESKWANVRDFVGWLGRKGEEENKNLLELTQSVALISMLDKNDADADAVQLATLHAAKGLEFKHVFLVGIEEGLLPHRDAEAEGRIAEERRLMYVGITRAERSLHLSWCQRRKQGKEWRSCEPSRFIGEMGGDLKFLGGSKEDTPQDKAAGRARLAQFKALLSGDQSI
ncbi:ATP-dependent DNA helicase Rep [Sterolibacterium denitrificans]|nr:UvrD-helicase domain-containing protein [Sterolibacterium denitrificans]KYC29014.1 ATP-dependent DNA helicase Rep [Sterolibacterium denitrificans]